jgi:hypothetical protein
MRSLSVTGRWWECPCGSEPPKRPGAATPVQTVISLRDFVCAFCGREYQEQYERNAREETDTEGQDGGIPA